MSENKGSNKGTSNKGGSNVNQPKTVKQSNNLPTFQTPPPPPPKKTK